MAKIEQYRQHIQKLLMKYSSYQSSEEDIEVQLLFDTERDHYQILDIGWDGYDRIYNCVMHLDIKDGRIWIQRNTTDIRDESFQPQPNPRLEKLTKQEALEQEIAIWQKAICVNPNNAEAHYHLGMAFYRHHQRQEATESLQNAIHLFKTQGNSHKAAEVQNFLWQLGLE